MGTTGRGHACEEALLSPEVYEIRSFLETNSGQYKITLNEPSRGLLIVMSAYHPEREAALTQLLRKLKFEFELLEFHGTSAVYIRSLSWPES